MTTENEFRSPVGGVFYHYTSRATAQEISIAGKIFLGGDGYIYVTDVLYKIGWHATDHLALPGKNAEVVIPIPEDVLPKKPDGSPDIEYGGIVPELPSGPGRSLRRGGRASVGNQAACISPNLSLVMDSIGGAVNG